MQYLLSGRTECVIQRSSNLRAACFGLLNPLLKLARFVGAEQAQAGHKTTEFFHRFPVFARQILFHAVESLQSPGQY